MKNYILIIAFGLLLQSCASLTNSQIEAVNQFAKSSQNFSAFPCKIMTGLAEVRMSRSLFYANSLSDAKLHVGELDSAYVQLQFDKAMSVKIDITFKIIDKYAQSLLLLSSDKFENDIDGQAKNFGIDIDSLIRLNNSLSKTTNFPSGIGGAVSQLVALGGTQYIRIKQAKEIKKFVLAADTLLNGMCLNMLTFLRSSTINDFIIGEERELARNYQSFLQQNPYHTIVDDQHYLVVKNNIEQIKKLRDQSIEGTEALLAAHKRLASEMAQKRTLKQAIEELQVLSQEVKNLKSKLTEIKTN